MQSAAKFTLAALAVLAAPGAQAKMKEIVVKVDARSGPWRTGTNPRLAYGVLDVRAPTIAYDATLRAGTTLRISATGTTTTVIGGTPYGPAGQAEWTADRGAAFFPSHFMDAAKRPIHLNELVGAFIDADGKVVGKPFPIGVGADVPVPDNAAALSLGLNDDNYTDNTGTLTVTIGIPQPVVTVEIPDDSK